MEVSGLAVEVRWPDGVVFEVKDQLLEHGCRLNSGQIVDSSIVLVPVQRDSGEDNAKIKAGGVPEDWQAKANKLRQKDVDVRWTKKGSKNY